MNETGAAPHAIDPLEMPDTLPAPWPGARRCAIEVRSRTGRLLARHHRWTDGARAALEGYDWTKDRAATSAILSPDPAERGLVHVTAWPLEAEGERLNREIGPAVAWSERPD